MARYKAYDLNQAKMIPLTYADQVVEGSFEHALNEIVEGHLDMSEFDRSDTDVGAEAAGTRAERCPCPRVRACDQARAKATGC